MLESATVQDLKRLLELFPIANLRQAWPSVRGTKEELCYSVAEQHQTDQIVGFVDGHLSCCKQHVYIFTRTPNVIDLPDALSGGEKLLEIPDDHALYIIRCQYSIILKAPLEEATLDFLWPVKIDITPKHLVVRFVVLEKNLSSYFERPYYVDGRSVEEKSVLGGVRVAANGSP